MFDGSRLGLPSWVGWLFLVLGIGIVSYLLSRLLSLPALTSKKGKKSLPVTFLDVTDGTASSWDEAMTLARRVLAEGNLRDCLWLGHRLLLLRLDHQDSIVFDRSKTNGAYLRECSSTARGRELLERLTECYEEVVYAHRTVPADEVKRLLAEVENL
jgi:Domain of unknown function (DUF4129)